MGYELHITRADLHDDAPKDLISLEEWLQVIRSDAELKLVDAARAVTTDGVPVASYGEGIAEWVETAPDGSTRLLTWFHYADGRIVITNPARQEIAKALQIAQRLKARVQGEEGEWYDQSSLATYPTRAQIEERLNPKPWWRKLFGR